MGKHLETCQYTETPFLAGYGQPWTQKRSENGHFSQRVVFFSFSTFTNIFRHGVLFETPRKALFHRKSYSKGPNHALEKDLTIETSCNVVQVNTPPVEVASRLDT